MKKRIKLPNGYGSITEQLDGNRRNRFIIKKSINGKQKIVGRKESYAEALAYLAEYNKNPSLFTPALITFAEVFMLWKEEKYKHYAQATQASMDAAYNNCNKLHEKKFGTITLGDVQSTIIDLHNKKIGYASQKKLRQLYQHLYNYAVKYKIITPDQDNGRYIDIDPHTILHPKTPFTVRQINKLKRAIGTVPYADMILMMIYSGCRPMEFCNISIKDIKIRQRYFIVTESKTKAGRGRAVPISKMTLPFFIKYMEQGNKYLVSSDAGDKLTYTQMRSRFNRALKQLNIKHTPHECRHTLATMLDNAGANDTAIKKILGHATQDITKNVYTHKSLKELKKAIDLLK